MRYLIRFFQTIVILCFLVLIVRFVFVFIYLELGHSIHPYQSSEGEHLNLSHYLSRFERLDFSDVHKIAGFIYYDVPITLISMVCLGGLFFVLKETLKSKDDYIPLKPKWLMTCSLGMRRIISVLINMFLAATMYFIVGVTATAYFERFMIELPKIFIVILATYFTVWCMVASLVNLGRWVVTGFQKEK